MAWIILGLQQGGEMEYDSQGWTKSTSCRGITTNAILWCRNKTIIASSEQDDETVLIHMLWLQKPGYWCQKNLKFENFLLIYVNVRHAHNVDTHSEKQATATKNTVVRWNLKLILHYLHLRGWSSVRKDLRHSVMRQWELLSCWLPKKKLLHVLQIL